MDAPAQVSVVMAVRNEALHIGRALGSVLAQDYPRTRLEIVIADGMSDDTTREIVTKFSADNKSIRISLIDNPERIVATGLNAAIARSVGDYVIRLDGHTWLAEDYVRQCVELLAADRADNVGGRMRPIAGTPQGASIALATTSRFGMGGGRFHISTTEEYVDTVYLGAWRRETLDELGGFDESLARNQDDELNYRLRKTGGRILLSPDVVSWYACRESLGGLWRQYYEYGWWKVAVLQRHPRQMQPRQFAPPALVAALGLCAGLTPVSRQARQAAIALGGTYVGGAVAASVARGRGEAPAAVMRLPLTFATLHFAYGLGFLNAIFRRALGIG